MRKGDYRNCWSAVAFRNVSTLPPASPAPRPPPWPQVAPSRPMRWPMFASLVIALVAVGLAIGCWFRPLPSNRASSTPPAPNYTDQQTADAKASVCAAFAKVDHALGVAAARNGGSDPNAGLAVATGTRQVFEVGSRYLLTKLSEEPATPSDIADATRRLANGYQEAVVDYLAEVGDSELKPALNASDDATLSLRRLCK
jgi:hypothetical protein